MLHIIASPGKKKVVRMCHLGFAQVATLGSLRSQPWICLIAVRSTFTHKYFYRFVQNSSKIFAAAAAAGATARKIGAEQFLAEKFVVG